LAQEMAAIAARTVDASVMSPNAFEFFHGFIGVPSDYSRNLE